MLDLASPVELTGGVSENDAQYLELLDIIACLSDAELAALDDDLDFHRFTGMPSMLILETLDRLGELDAEWRPLLQTKLSVELPAIR